MDLAFGMSKYFYHLENYWNWLYFYDDLDISYIHSSMNGIESLSFERKKYLKIVTEI